MKPKSILIAGMTLALASVLLGSFGVHFLEIKLPGWYDDAQSRLENWKTGLTYQMFHSLGLMGIGSVTIIRSRWRSISASLMVIGVLLFSGGLYGWVLMDQTWLVMIVPIGGLTMIFGWLAAIIGVSLGPDRSTIQR
jgi:uncharacterized membrane protein YgdD (TMEM256/DUF423 family)